MKIVPLRKDLKLYIEKHGLKKKWEKVFVFLKTDFRHPSLNIELLQPHWRGIYSLRIDKEYRALFFIKKGIIEIFCITNHYK